MKKAAFIITVIVLLIIINSLAHSIYDLWHKQDLLTSAQKELVAEELNNKKLKTDLSYSNTPQFLEEQARNKLFLVKPGEQEVLMAQKLNKDGTSQDSSGNIPNWQQWINLFK